MTGVLQTANLGDSGFLLVRNKEVIKRSQKQTHTFNTPKVWFQNESRDVFRDYVKSYADYFIIALIWALCNFNFM